MTARTASAATPILTSLETAVRQAWASLCAASAPVPGAGEIEGAQAHIRRESRHWLIG